MFYYCILSIIGNDINPSTMTEVNYLTIFIFGGAFLEAYIIGGITAELIKGYDHKVKCELEIDYVHFTMEIHNFPDLIRVEIIDYINKYN